MPSGKILVASGNPSEREALEGMLRNWGYDPKTVPGLEETWPKIQNGSLELVLMDYTLVEGEPGWAPRREGAGYVPWVFLVPPDSLLPALAALRGGLDDYLTLPLKEEEVSFTVGKALERGRFLRDHPLTQEEAIDLSSSIVAKSQEMREVVELAAQVARSDATVLLLGESGVGKELFARAIHGESPRRSRPFVKVDCAALPEGLLESELFGHEKGAFTDARKQKPGRFELAQGGTIFLDEIISLSLSLQAKLLRVLQEREFERVGGTRTLRVDVRILAATNQDPGTALRERRLREDLYYRLNVFPLRIPPLRRRREDIPLLAQHFLDKFCRRYRKGIMGLSPKALDLLACYPWPGNVRELEHCLERAVIISEGPLLMEQDISLDRNIGELGFPQHGGSMTLEELEKEYIRRILRQVRGHKSKAAQILGINRKTLLEKRRRYALD